MSATVIIPARYGSVRFPAKCLAAETGRPLVQHAVDQARKCKRVREVIVATDDSRISTALKPFDTRVVMTDPNHQSGTDRVAQVARDLKDDFIVNLQGDEPEIEPATIDGLIELLETAEGEMATAVTPFPRQADVNDPNLVKAVLDLDDRAIFFSRCAIPFARDGAAANYFLHLGIYAYHQPFLLRFAEWEPTTLEKTEKLEQLRAIEHRVEIFVLKVERAAHGIDTPEQYADFVKRFRSKGSA